MTGQQISRYLNSRGWQPSEGQGGCVMYFDRPSGKGCMTVPMYDNQFRFGLIVAMIAEEEGRNHIDVMRDIDATFNCG